jgi:uncharacterized protein YgiM (DUF1202 family)
MTRIAGLCAAIFAFAAVEATAETRGSRTSCALNVRSGPGNEYRIKGFIKTATL